MEFVIPIIKTIHVLVSIFLIVVVLLQPGKSGDLGSVFGGGTSESMFGSAGAVPFLAKLTRLFAVIFLFTSLALGYFSVRSVSSSVIGEDSVMEQPLEEKLPEPEEGTAGNITEQSDSENEVTENKQGEDKATDSSKTVSGQTTEKEN